VALVAPDGSIAEFLSYEGTLTAVNGPLAGVTSNGNQDPAPFLSNFPLQMINEDSDLIFNASNGNEITVSDVDAELDDVEITLTVVNGTLTLAGIPGLAGNGTGTVSFVADISAANSALDGLTYRGAQDFNGQDTLQIV